LTTFTFVNSGRAYGVTVRESVKFATFWSSFVLAAGLGTWHVARRT
jgi:hypothetical protein